MSKRGHSVCLECRRFISVNMDGRLRKHVTLEGHDCPGSGAPLPQTIKEALTSAVVAIVATLGVWATFIAWAP